MVGSVAVGVVGALVGGVLMHFVGGHAIDELVGVHAGAPRALEFQAQVIRGRLAFVQFAVPPRISGP